MPWIQITISSSAAHAEALGAALIEQGAVSVTFQDSHDNPIFEPGPGETLLWGDTDVVGLFNSDVDISGVSSALAHHTLAGASFSQKIELIEDKVWEREWMNNFQPVRFGRRLWICPGWCEVPDPGAINVILDPGLAFGTGSHPTTALCLNWLDQLNLSGKCVIDFGCGSGILAIAALKLGAAHAVGIDIDPQAIEASRGNARRNGVADRLTLYLADEQPDSLSADVVVANILAAPLRELAAKISAMTRRGGNLGLSGILTTQAPAIIEIYQRAFKFDPVTEKEEWCRVTGVKMG